MLILIDMDDVLADFDGEVYTRWNKLHPDKFIVPPDKRNCFYLHEEMPDESRELIREINTSEGFIANLPEIPGSIEAVKEISALGHSVFICTAPLIRYRYCVKEKYQWVEEHLGCEWIEKLVLTRDKTIIRGDILIDDKPKITGVAEPVWEHVIYEKSYNREIKGQRRLTWNDWKEILPELL